MKTDCWDDLKYLNNKAKASIKLLFDEFDFKFMLTTICLKLYACIKLSSIHKKL